MTSHIFSSAWRVLTRNKTNSFINMAGLATGIAAAILIFTILRSEMSYDRFQTRGKGIYRLVTENHYDQGTSYEEGMPAPVARALRNDLQGVQSVTELYSSYGSQFNIEGRDPATEKKFIEDKGVFFADSACFEVFDGQWLAGNPALLGQPGMAVLDRSHAIKYFGDWKQALGHHLRMDNLVTLEVAGVIEDMPSHTDFPFHVLVSYPTLVQHAGDYGYQVGDWKADVGNHQVYLLLKDQVNPGNINGQLKGFTKKYFLDNPKLSLNAKKDYFLQPLGEIHFDTRFGNFGDHLISRSTLVTLSFIGVFILLMAAINFINLSTAYAITRSREMGIRKVLGGQPWQLIWQVLQETFLLVSISTVAGFLLANLLLPYLHYISSLPGNMHLWDTPGLIFIALLMLALTLLSGLYPALVLSRYNPSLVLKGMGHRSGLAGISLRRILVVAQFTISQVLVIGMLVAWVQMHFVRHADLGFNKEAILLIPNINDSANAYKSTELKKRLLEIPGVQSASLLFDAPSSPNNWEADFHYDHQEKNIGYNLSIKQGDADYFKTFGLTILAGRAYSPSDTPREVVINETLVHKLGLTQPRDVLGKTIRLGKNWLPIVGVVKDFQTSSLREQVRPIAIFSKKAYCSNIAVKLNSPHLTDNLKAIQALWEKTFPDFVYTPAFLDERIAAFYKQENQLELAYKIFALLAIGISCLGVYGLVSFMAVRKTKEIGIRKVLGASSRGIVFMLSREFFWLLLLSFAMASPIAYYFMEAWLRNFAYRIPLGIPFFLAAFVISLLIAGLAVGYKSIQAALANPIHSLRSE